MPTTAADVLIRAVMTGSSGLPADTYINDFAFRLIAGGTPTTGELDDAMDAVDEFYNTVTASTRYIGGMISAAVDRGATHELQAYSISAGGSPIYTRPWLGPDNPAVSTNLPSEVAAVLSFHGDLTGVLEESGATRPRARRRGRIYIGPLTTGAVDGTADDPLINPLWVTTMNQAANVMGDAALADGWMWSVWSRAANELYEIVAGWVDNAPDTQRRRGATSTTRTVFTR